MVALRSALADCHEMTPRGGSFSIELRFDNRILQDALGGNTRRTGFDRRLAVGVLPAR
jgi:hypothetical protein